MRRCLGLATGCIAVLSVVIIRAPAAAQELEPGADRLLPVGLNILTGVDSVSWGDLTFDPALPVTDGSARINTTAVAYTRALAIGGRSANAGVQVPLVGGHVEGLYLGNFTEVGRLARAIPGSGWRSISMALRPWRPKHLPPIGCRPSSGRASPWRRHSASTTTPK